MKRGSFRKASSSGVFLAVWIKRSRRSNALVSITNGNDQTRTVLTNAFGYYRSDEIPVGETYIFSVQKASVINLRTERRFYLLMMREMTLIL
jgi:hypothetical protein